MAEASPNVTALLRQVAQGDKTAETALFSAIYPELRVMARRLFRREAADHTLQTTALVHEAYLRLAQPRGAPFADRVHFFAVAATVMRRILVDHARAKHAAKRGGVAPEFSLDPCLTIEDPAQVLQVDLALERLAALDPRQAKIVELRFFAGMTVEEVAHALAISERTVKREWQVARAWLLGELRP